MLLESPPVESKRTHTYPLKRFFFGRPPLLCAPRALSAWENTFHNYKPNMASTPPPEPESEPAEPEEEEIMLEVKSDSTPLQDSVVDNEQNEGAVGYSADEAGNATGSADATAPGSVGGVAEPENSQPPATEVSNLAQDRPQLSGTSSEQQILDAGTHAKNSSQEQEYPTTQGGGSAGVHEENIHQEYQFDGTMDSKPHSPVGFGIEDDAAGGQSERGGAEGFDSGGHHGRGIEDDAMHLTSSQPPPRSYVGSSEGNDGDKHTSMGSNQGFGDEAIDDSGSRGRRMFDGSRVAEPDDFQIVDASDGADIIPGVDDLPVFANDQSKALNDEIKVREGSFGRREQMADCARLTVLVHNNQSDTGERPKSSPQQDLSMTFLYVDAQRSSEKSQRNLFCFII